MNDLLYPTDGVDQYTIGIDVSKKTLVIAGAATLPTSIPNTLAACKRLVKRLRRMGPRVVAVEATGGYERILVRALWDADLPVAILQPSRVRAHTKSAGQLAKTDRIDAAAIVDFARSMKIRLARRPCQDAEKLRVLCDRRSQIVQDRVREIGRLEAMHDPSMQREIKRHIKHLQKLEHSLDERIQQLVNSSESLKRKSAILRRNTGVGPVVAATLLASLPELGHVNRQAIAALGGLAPFANESGQWRGQRSIFAGRAAVRRAMYLAAMSSTRSGGPMRDRYRLLIENGKAKKVALVAVARRMLVGLNAQMAEHLAAHSSPQEA